MAAMMTPAAAAVTTAAAATAAGTFRRRRKTRWTSAASSSGSTPTCRRGVSPGPRQSVRTGGDFSVAGVAPSTGQFVGAVVVRFPFFFFF